MHLPVWKKKEVKRGEKERGEELGGGERNSGLNNLSLSSGTLWLHCDTFTGPLANNNS